MALYLSLYWEKDENKQKIPGLSNILTTESMTLIEKENNIVASILKNWSNYIWQASYQIYQNFATKKPGSEINFRKPNTFWTAQVWWVLFACKPS